MNVFIIHSNMAIDARMETGSKIQYPFHIVSLVCFLPQISVMLCLDPAYYVKVCRVQL